MLTPKRPTPLVTVEACDLSGQDEMVSGAALTAYIRRFSVAKEDIVDREEITYTGMDGKNLKLPDREYLELLRRCELNAGAAYLCQKRSPIGPFWIDLDLLLKRRFLDIFAPVPILPGVRWLATHCSIARIIQMTLRFICRKEVPGASLVNLSYVVTSASGDVKSKTEGTMKKSSYTLIFHGLQCTNETHRHLADVCARVLCKTIGDPAPGQSWRERVLDPALYTSARSNRVLFNDKVKRVRCAAHSTRETRHQSKQCSECGLQSANRWPTPFAAVFNNGALCMRPVQWAVFMTMCSLRRVDQMRPFRIPLQARNALEAWQFTEEDAKKFGVRSVGGIPPIAPHCAQEAGENTKGAMGGIPPTLPPKPTPKHRFPKLVLDSSPTAFRFTKVVPVKSCEMYNARYFYGTTPQANMFEYAERNELGFYVRLDCPFEIKQPGGKLKSVVSRRYAAYKTFAAFFQAYRRIPAKARFVYEIVPPDTPHKFYMDIEWNDTSAKFQKKYTRLRLYKLCEYAAKALFVVFRPLIRPKMSLRAFVRRFLRSLRVTQNHRRATDAKMGPIWRYSFHVCSTWIFLENVEVAAYLFHKILLPFLVSSVPEDELYFYWNGKRKCFIDLEVYTRNRTFRFLFSSKTDQTKFVPSETLHRAIALVTKAPAEIPVSRGTTIEHISMHDFADFVVMHTPQNLPSSDDSGDLTADGPLLLTGYRAFQCMQAFGLSIDRKHRKEIHATLDKFRARWAASKRSKSRTVVAAKRAGLNSEKATRSQVAFTLNRVSVGEVTEKRTRDSSTSIGTLEFRDEARKKADLDLRTSKKKRCADGSSQVSLNGNKDAQRLVREILTPHMGTAMVVYNLYVYKNGTFKSMSGSCESETAHCVYKSSPNVPFTHSSNRSFFRIWHTKMFLGDHRCTRLENRDPKEFAVPSKFMPALVKLLGPVPAGGGSGSGAPLQNPSTAADYAPPAAKKPVPDSVRRWSLDRWMMGLVGTGASVGSEWDMPLDMLRPE